MKIILVLLIALIFPHLSQADMIIGGEITYTVQKGDILELIGAKLGVDWRIIVRENNMDTKTHLQIGQRLRVNTRKIVPQMMDNGIIVNIPDRMLYFFKDGKLDMVFPVGLGMPSWRGITQWRTPTGRFKIIGKRKDPTWHVPESMQWKMEMEGKPVKKIVPPGPDNPLGRYAVDTTIPRVVIHETIWPTTVYRFRSHGCIRVLTENMEQFFNEVEIHTPGEILYEPVKVAVSEGKIYLEVHGDIYGKYEDLGEKTKKLIEVRGLSNKVDWNKVERVLKEKSGIAEDVSL